MGKTTATWVAVMGAILMVSSAASAQSTCLIFVHGKQTDTNTFTQANGPRNYWFEDGGWFGDDDDFIAVAREGVHSTYAVGYNGTRPYWHSEAAGEVAREIVNAANGGADSSGRRCATTYANGGTFIVIAHSMGGAIMDYITGNNDASDPDFNFSGPFDQATNVVSRVYAVSGAHRGSEGADAACGDSSLLCDVLATFIQDCDSATYWLRSADDMQPRYWASSPARSIHLTGGYEQIMGSGACLSGEDDGVVQFASEYACGGSATTGYEERNVCGNAAKQETSGFYNMDTSAEDHDDIRSSDDEDDRRAIPDGVWWCGSSRCAPDTVVVGGESAAEFLRRFY